MQTSDTATPSESVSLVELSNQVRQLRMLIIWLGLALLITSGALTAYVIKQNRNLITATRNRTQQANQLQAAIESMIPVLSELAEYSSKRPELAELFKKYGLSYTITEDKPAPASKQ